MFAMKDARHITRHCASASKKQHDLSDIGCQAMTTPSHYLQRNLGNSFLQPISESLQSLGQMSAQHMIPTVLRQCDCGGSCTSCAGKAKEHTIQTKLTITPADDVCEQEAERVADRVMAMTPCCDVSSVPLGVQRFTGQTSGEAGIVPASVDHVLTRPGNQLEPELRKDMEHRFSDDFSQVRIHTGSEAAQSAREIQANAYTAGNQIVFGAGKYDPGTFEGKRLIAHELTHTIQQRGAEAPAIQREVVKSLGCEKLKAAIPGTSKKSKGKMPLSKVEKSELQSGGQAKSIAMAPLTKEGNTGGRPDESVFEDQFEAMRKMPVVGEDSDTKTEAGYWVRAHLIHGPTDKAPERHLHGPGSKENLIIADKSLNGSMRNDCEECALHLIHDRDVALWYESEASPSNVNPNYAEKINVTIGFYNIVEGKRDDSAISETAEYTNKRTIPGAAPVKTETVPYLIVLEDGSQKVIKAPVRKPNGRVEWDIQESEILPGLVLEKVRLVSDAEVKKGRRDVLEGTLDVDKAKHHKVLRQKRKSAPIILDRETRAPKEGKITVQSDKQFYHLNYLSEATIDHLRLENGELHGTGTLKPSIPILNGRPMQVEYGPDKLRAFYGTTQANIPQRGGMARLTRCTLGVDLLPELKPSGEIAFAMNLGGKEFLTGDVEVSANEKGLQFDAAIKAHIPGTDDASGTAHYRDEQWIGEVKVEASKMRIPGVQRGELRIDFSSGQNGNWSIIPSGKIDLLVANQPAALEITYVDNRIIYTGKGGVQIPSMHEVDIDLTYDGTTFTGSARNIGFTWRGIDGIVNLQYRQQNNGAGAVTGDGTLAIKRKNVSGDVKVKLNNEGKMSGSGSVKYPFQIRGRRVDAEANVVINEQQQVHVDGEMRMADPINLFPDFGDSKELFHIQRNIPIPGASIGPVGLVAVVEGGLSAHYKFGPGQFRNVAIKAAFNPLDEQVNPNLAFHGELYIPARAGIAGTIGGGLGVDAGLGSVTGTVTVGASLDLNATAGGPLDAQYSNSRIEIKARAGIDAGLDLGLSLDAHARAQAGIGRFSIGREKSWNLGNRTVQLGRFSMHAPIRWSSDGDFTPPTLEKIEWGPPPQIDLANVITQLFNSASAQEKEK